MCRAPCGPAHAFSVTVFTLNTSSLKQWAEELCSLCAAPDASERLRSAHFYLRQLQGPGWRGHPVEGGKFEPKKRKKKKKSAKKLLGSGNINSEVFFRTPPKEDWGHLGVTVQVIYCLPCSVFQALTSDFLCIAISLFLVGNDPWEAISFHYPQFMCVFPSI